LPEMMEAGADQYDVVEKFHECAHELRDTGAMLNYDLDFQL